MALERMWAGWRNEFVTAGASAGDPSEDRAAERSEDRSEECVFCRILSGGDPDEVTHVVWRHPAGEVVALLNAYPYTSGHLMVMPVRHVADLEALTAGEAAALMEGIQGAVVAIKAAYRPGGVNLGANLGKAAGAGIPGHLHLHALPRWVGDTNFMTTVAETRVLPESLDLTDAKLRAAWPS